MVAWILFFIVAAFGSGVFVGWKFGAKALAEVKAAKESAEAQVEAWKNAAEAKVDEIKSRF